jgi:hypothetical protein
MCPGAILHLGAMLQLRVASETFVIG